MENVKMNGIMADELLSGITGGSAFMERMENRLKERSSGKPISASDARFYDILEEAINQTKKYRETIGIVFTPAEEEQYFFSVFNSLV